MVEQRILPAVDALDGDQLQRLSVISLAVEEAAHLRDVFVDGLGTVSAWHTWAGIGRLPPWQAVTVGIQKKNV
jgi:hypothetical protein